MRAPDAPPNPLDVLVVDDDPLFRRYLAHVLRQAGFHIRIASDGPGLRAALAQAVPDAVVLDVVLQSESGLDLCRELRANDAYCDLVIIATSAAAGSMVTARVDEVSALAAGANGFVPKGRSSEPLVAMIHQALAAEAA
ncbi:MAG: response regulator [Acidimicrobiales bacterium]